MGSERLYTFTEDNLIKLLEEIQEDALDADGNFYGCHFRERWDFIDEINSWCLESR